MGIFAEHVIYKKRKFVSMPYYHSHPYYELYYLKEGSSVLYSEANGTNVRISMGDFFLVPADKNHHMKGLTSDSYNVRIEKNDIPYELYDAFAKCVDKRECISVPKGKRKYFEYQLSEIYSEFISMNKLGEIMLYASTMALLVDIIRFATEKIEPAGQMSTNSTIEKVFAYIGENYMNHISIDDLAKVANMSKSYFSHFFKEQTMTTPVEYINRIRVDMAAKYILEDRYSVSEIAQMCGFKSTSYFCAMFKKYTGFVTEDYKIYNSENIRINERGMVERNGRT